MNIQQKVDIDFFKILEAIKRDSLITKETSSIEYRFTKQTNNNDLSIHDQKRILNALEELKVITVRRYEYVENGGLSNVFCIMVPQNRTEKWGKLREVFNPPNYAQRYTQTI